jgi:hypothetical protein
VRYSNTQCAALIRAVRKHHLEGHLLQSKAGVSKAPARAPQVAQIAGESPSGSAQSAKTTVRLNHVVGGGYAPYEILHQRNGVLFVVAVLAGCTSTTVKN